MQIRGERKAEPRRGEHQRVAVACAPGACNLGREPRPARSNRFAQRPREREPDRSTWSDRLIRCGANKDDRQGRRRKPGHADGIARTLPSTRGTRDLDRARRRLNAKRNHTASRRDHPLPNPHLVGDLGDRLDEPQPQRRMRRDGQPPLCQPRPRCVQHQSHRPTVPKRPAKPGRPGDDNHDRDRLPRLQQSPGQKQATANRKRNRNAARPESPRRHQRTAKRLHLHPGQGHRVPHQSRPRPPEHRSPQANRDRPSQPADNPDQPATTPTTTNPPPPRTRHHSQNIRTQPLCRLATTRRSPRVRPRWRWRLPRSPGSLGRTS
jgi:hypothetical protein